MMDATSLIVSQQQTRTRPVRIAGFAMGDANHFKNFLPVVAELVRAGAAVQVWTDAGFGAPLAAVGAAVADVFAAGSLEAADGDTRPVPARFVSFAAVHADRLMAEVQGWGADLVLCESFAVIGRVVAVRLGLPWINVYPGHIVDAAACRAAIRRDQPSVIAPACAAAVETLQTIVGLGDITPWSYIADPSPWLNIEMEPPEWWTPAEQAALRPVVFFGSAAEAATIRADAQPFDPRHLRLYVSFGTIVWRYWRAEALAALAEIAAAVRAIPGTTAVIGLGGAGLGAEVVAALNCPAVRTEDYADQARELARADLFITHQGTGSTHEAIAAGVPMLSLPFFFDQPAVAARAQAFGLALPLAEGRAGITGSLTAVNVRAQIAAAVAQRAAMMEALLDARAWDIRARAARLRIAGMAMNLACLPTQP